VLQGVEAIHTVIAIAAIFTGTIATSTLIHRHGFLIHDPR
jgi:hypothetical protein